VIFLGLFVLSSLSLREQTSATDRLVEANRERLHSEAGASQRATINQMRVILDRKAARQNWSPALSEIGRLLPNALILDRIEASAAVKAGDQKGMVLTGHLRYGSGMDPVVEYARKLSGSELYRGQFAEARVDRMDTSGSDAKFSIICPLRAGITASEVGDD